MMVWFRTFNIVMLFVLIGCSDVNPESGLLNTTTGKNWPIYGGNKAGNRYSPLNQIHKENVTNLEVVWMYDASQVKDSVNQRPKQIQCQPIVIDGILYGTTADLKLFAIKADTGEELWRFKPADQKKERFGTSRGVVYWKGHTGEQRILYTVGSNLYAIDATTGVPVVSFGNQGIVDLHEGLSVGVDKDISTLSVTASSPGIIYKNLLIMGSSVAEDGNAAPGHIRAFNVLTGKLEWVFRTIPQPGDQGYDTWPKATYNEIGGANNWAGMTLDEKRGAVYFGTGSPSSDFYGGNRAGKNIFANCIVALDAASGKLVWYYQTIYHDLWDRDISCQPNLATINFNGNEVDVVAQATKDGLLYVLNRDTGESLFPVEERAVPTDGLPGETPWGVQKFPLKPAPFSRQVLKEEDITDRTDAAHEYVIKQFNRYESAHKFAPPSEKGTLLFGYSGGAEWGGNAIDKDGVLYQNANEEAWILEMADVEKFKVSETATFGETLYMKNCAMCHGATKEGGAQFPSLINIADKLSINAVNSIINTGVGRMPSFNHLQEKEIAAISAYILNISEVKEEKDSHRKAFEPSESIEKAESTVFGFQPRYVVKSWKRLLDQDGYPGIKPPWGTLNAIDLGTGEYKWKVPLGEYQELTKKGEPVTGTDSYGGPIVTAGGLVFIAGTKDEKIRAFDKETGEQLWEYKLPAGGFATPITYEVNNKQFVVIAAGGGRGQKPGGNYVAFALKD